MSPPPEGDIFVRSPLFARAQAIREQVALLKSLKQPVPPHLQALFNALKEESKSAVQAVEETTGVEDVEVTVDKGEPAPADVGSNSNIFTEPTPEPEPAPEPEPEPAPEPQPVAEPEPVVTEAPKPHKTTRAQRTYQGR